MRSRIYVGHVMHARREPVPHSFRYPSWALALDLDELDTLGRELRLFRRGRRGLVSFRDSDHLGTEPGTVREKLEMWLRRTGVEERPDRVQLLTTPRVLGHAFNPVSFYYCQGPDGRLRYAVAEVNNTFGDGHVYLLDSPVREDGWLWHRQRKRFHVSPFHDMSGIYAFRLAPLASSFDIRIDLRRDDRTAFVSRWWGEARPLDDAGLARVLLTHPLTTVLTLPRILWQALRLWLVRGLPVYERPDPVDPLTYPSGYPPRLGELAAPPGCTAPVHPVPPAAEPDTRARTPNTTREPETESRAREPV